MAVTIEQCWHAVPGGTAAAALELCRELRADPELDVIGVSAWHRRPPVAPWQIPIPVRRLPLGARLLYETWHGLRLPPVRLATGAVRVIHATGVAVPPRSAPLVVTVHDLAFLHDRSRFTRHGVRFFLAALDRTQQDADLVLCSSAATLADCVTAGFEAGRLRLVPLGVRVKPASSAAVAAVCSRFGLRRRYVCFVGTAEPRKNLPRLVAAFEGLKRTDVDLVLVGSAGWGVELAQLLAPLGDRAHVLGVLSNDDRDAIVAGSAVMCYPSLFEGFGLPVLEAMAQGTPVVTSAGIATEEAAGGAALLVDPYDVAAIVTALAEVLEDDARADQLREAGRHRAAAMSWQTHAELTKAAYREVLGA